MNGIFNKRRKSDSIICFVCGLFFIGLYIFFDNVDPEATNEIMAFLIVGVVICLVSFLFWLLNLGAFFKINDDSISAKYHWFGKIDCKMTDVDFAIAGINTLTIKLKNSKCYTIVGIENSWALCSVIRRNMHFEPTEQPEALNEKLNKLKEEKKKGILYVCSGLALMFINIFIAVFLTEKKEFHEFGKTDWIIMSIMCVIEIVTIIATFYFAQRAGINNIPIEQTKYTIQRTIVETKPLLPGNIIKVLTDDNYTGRITLFGYQNEKSLYYAVQEFTTDYTLIKVYESEIFENVEQLYDHFKGLIDITEKFYINTKAR